MSAVITGIVGILLILCSWVIVASAFVGVGTGIRSLYGTSRLRVDDLFLCFWLGFGTILILLEIWHCFYKIDGNAFSLVLCLGFAGHLLTRGEAFRSGVSIVRNLRPWFVILLIGVIVWVCNRATAGPDFFDSGNYHFPVIRWVTTYPIVKGLGNLDGHLAFNNASLLYQGMLETGFWVHRSAHLGNGILLLVLLLFGLFNLYESVQSREFSVHALFPAVMVTILVSLTVEAGAYVATPNTDLPGLTVMAVIAYILLGASENTRPEEEAFRVQVCILLCCAALSIKLSAAAYAFSACVCIVTLWLARTEIPFRYRMRVAAIGLLTTVSAVLLWSGRSVILTGYPFFPSLVFPFTVAWRVPPVYAEWYQWWITTFARAPYREAVSGEGLDWIWTWITVECRIAKIPGVLPLVLTVVAVTYQGLSRGRRSLLYRFWPAWIPVIVALGAWFKAAPSFRFGGGLMWILASQSVGLALTTVLRERPQLIRLAALGLCSLPITAIIAQTILREQTDRAGALNALASTMWQSPGPDHGMQTVHETPFAKFLNPQGVTVYEPRSRPPCPIEHWRDCVMWYGPIPGAQRPENTLSYLGARDPREGFKIDETRDLWIARHAANVREKSKTMNVRQLAFYFQVAPRTIRMCLDSTP